MRNRQWMIVDKAAYEAKGLVVRLDNGPMSEGERRVTRLKPGQRWLRRYKHLLDGVS